MMKKPYRQPLVAINAVIFLFIVAASAKSADECSVMVPMMGTIWKTNELVTVRWSGIKEGKIPSIILARKNEEGTLVNVAKIATDISAGSGKHSLKLPANIPPADQYVVMLKDEKNTKCTSSSFFIEQGSTGTPVNIQNPSSNAALPSLDAPTQGSNTGTQVTPSSASSDAPGSYRSNLASSSSSRHSRSAHEAVRTGTTTQDPNSAEKTSNVAIHTMSLLLALVILAQVVAG